MDDLSSRPINAMAESFADLSYTQRSREHHNVVQYTAQDSDNDNCDIISMEHSIAKGNSVTQDDFPRTNRPFLLPPKKTFKRERLDPLERSQSIATQDFTAINTTGANIANDDIDCDMPINLSIKTESFHEEDRHPSALSSIHQTYTQAKRMPLLRSDSYELSGSSQESPYCVSSFVRTGSLQESSSSLASCPAFSSSQESTHSNTNQLTSGSSQESPHSLQAPSHWGDDDESGFPPGYNVMQMSNKQRSRLERRRQQNREAARRLREKRKKYLDSVYAERRDFENQLLNLQHENDRLKQNIPMVADDAIVSGTDLDSMKKENIELREQLKQEHHECKLHVEKLQLEANELRQQLLQALKDNKHLRKMIDNHKQQCPSAF